MLTGKIESGKDGFGCFDSLLSCPARKRERGAGKKPVRRDFQRAFSGKSRECFQVKEWSLRAGLRHRAGGHVSKVSTLRRLPVALGSPDSLAQFPIEALDGIGATIMEAIACRRTRKNNAKVSPSSPVAVEIITGTRGKFSILQRASKKLFSDGLAKGDIFTHENLLSAEARQAFL
jgi:hypothetical protein